MYSQRVRWAVSLLLTGLLAGASYDGLLKKAERITNVGRFLEEYVGECESSEPTFDRAACESRAQEARAQYRGRTLVIEMGDVSEQIAFGGWDDRQGAYRLLLTPFFSERALGLSVGKPRLSGTGAPVVKNIPIWVRRPKGEPDFGFRRQLERGMVRLELVVRPQGAWRLRGKGEAAVRGAEVSLIGIRVYASRGQQILAEQTY